MSGIGFGGRDMMFFTRSTSIFDAVIKEETAYLNKYHPDGGKRKSAGLCCSGGGIRSASFSIGIMQALHNKGILNKFSYLSTVSGGGFCGSALSWFQMNYGVFPFGEKEKFEGSQAFDLKQERLDYLKPEASKTSRSNLILSYIRQHGNYLIPFQLGTASFAGRVMLSVLNSAAAYLAILALFFLLLLEALNLDFIIPFSWGVWNFFGLSCDDVRTALGGWEEISIFSNLNAFNLPSLNFMAFFAMVAALCATFYLVIVLLYGLFTVRFSGRGWSYCLRVRAQWLIGWLLYLLGFSVVLALLPIGFQLLFGDGVGKDDTLTIGAITMPTIVGMIMALYRFQKDLQNKPAFQKIYSMILLLAVILALIFAILTLGFMLGHWAYSQGPFGVPAKLAFFGVIFLLYAVNLNLVSPHRMYRDRLMETFMWDPDTDPERKLCKMGAAANRAKLSEMLAGKKQKNGKERFWSPYHILNTNLVLTDAKRPKNRGRKGDNFILSPLFCGSVSTGYRDTKNFIANRLTLATSMATSGAAANPNAGVAGQGPTTNPLVSFLMTFCGLRLGLWTINPRNRLLNAYHKIAPPNYIWPGIPSLLGNGQREHSCRIELSDGGHFDNTGLYELIRRKVKLIVLCDGSADPEYHFDDLGNVTERVRADFGVQIYFPKDTQPYKDVGWTACFRAA